MYLLTWDVKPGKQPLMNQMRKIYLWGQQNDSWSWYAWTKFLALHHWFVVWRYTLTKKMAFFNQLLYQGDNDNHFILLRFWYIKTEFTFFLCCFTYLWWCNQFHQEKFDEGAVRSSSWLTAANMDVSIEITFEKHLISKTGKKCHSYRMLSWQHDDLNFITLDKAKFLKGYFYGLDSNLRQVVSGRSCGPFTQ